MLSNQTIDEVDLRILNYLLKDQIKPAFHELKVLKHLNAAGFKKKFGFTCAYLFRIVFVLLFHQKNWFRLLESKKGETFPAEKWESSLRLVGYNISMGGRWIYHENTSAAEFI